MIRLQRHIGAVALMGPGSDAEWDWLPTELGCCCPESESNTHNANVSAEPTHAGARGYTEPPGQGTPVPAGVGVITIPGPRGCVLRTGAPRGSGTESAAVCYLPPED